MVAIKRAIEPVERQQAQERQLAGKPVEDSTKGEVRERIASSLGISHDTLSKAEVIVEAAEKEPEKYKELLDKVDKKEVSVNKAYHEVRPRKSKEAKDVVFLSDNLYDAILVAIEQAKEKGEKQIPFRHDGHTIKSVGVMELTV